MGIHLSRKRYFHRNSGVKLVAYRSGIAETASQLQLLREQVCTNHEETRKLSLALEEVQRARTKFHQKTRDEMLIISRDIVKMKSDMKALQELADVRIQVRELVATQERMESEMPDRVKQVVQKEREWFAQLISEIKMEMDEAKADCDQENSTHRNWDIKEVNTRLDIIDKRRKEKQERRMRRKSDGSYRSSNSSKKIKNICNYI